MKLSFTGILDDGEVFIDADTGEPDHNDRQATEPVRLRDASWKLPDRDRNGLLDRFFDGDNHFHRIAMLRGVGIAEDEITGLIRGSTRRAWDVFEPRLLAKREAEWNENDKRRPHLSLWGYRRRMVRVEDWEGTPRHEVVIRVKHFVLSNDAEVARLTNEAERLERLEHGQPVSREPIPEDVQSLVWGRDGGRCVKCGSQERIEFAYIIPLGRGGSNTERNIQLLCEGHNRQEGVADVLFPAIEEEEDS